MYLRSKWLVAALERIIQAAMLEARARAPAHRRMDDVHALRAADGVDGLSRDPRGVQGLREAGGVAGLSGDPLTTWVP